MGSFFYDSHLCLRQLTAPEGSYVHHYRGAGNLLSGMSLPGGLRITNQFDAYGRLKGTWLKATAQTVLNYHGYDYNVTVTPGTTVR